MREQVRTWLNNPTDYEAGMALYDKLGTNAYFKKLMRKRNDAFNRRRLHQLLTDVYEDWDQPISSPTTAHITVSEHKPLVTPSTFSAEELAVIASAKESARKKYQEFKNKRAHLFSLCSLKPNRHENAMARVKERHDIVKELTDLRKCSDKLYADYHYAELHGKLPGTPEPVNKKRSAIQLMKDKSNLMKNISHHTRHPDQSPKRLNMIAQKKAALTATIDALNELEHGTGGVE